MGEPEKILMIGEQLTADIMFGNLNKMMTVWTTKYKDTCDNLIKRSDKYLYDLEQSLRYSLS